MAPFSIPVPCIIPLRIPVFGGKRTIDTQTKIELLCETYLEHEVFYTLDGTKPQPYAGIVQGSKLYKYKSPICLPAGKVTIKAMALNAHVRSMRSSVVTKCFDVVKAECESTPKTSVKKGERKLSSKNLCKELDFSNITTGSNDVLENTGFHIDDQDVKDFLSLEDMPINPKIQCYNGDDLSDSQSEICSISSLPEKENVLKAAEYETEGDMHETENSSPLDGEENGHMKGDFVTNYSEDECAVGDDNSKVEREVSACKVSLESRPYCIKCEMTLQHCLMCNTLSDILSKYCIQCGEKLMHSCSYCKALNTVIATFCQYCGKKIELNDGEMTGIDCGTMAEPQRIHASVQQSPISFNKETQTSPEQKRGNLSKDFLSRSSKKLPPHSPGRGYWHQQLDYICNHLKTYAYNNSEFRESISEPALSEFQTASVIKSDDSRKSEWQTFTIESSL